MDATFGLAISVRWVDVAQLAHLINPNYLQNFCVFKIGVLLKLKNINTECIGNESLYLVLKLAY